MKTKPEVSNGRSFPANPTRPAEDQTFVKPTSPGIACSGATPNLRRWRRGSWLAGLLLCAQSGWSAGPTSAGNTDGLLTWRLGDIAAGQTAGQVVLFAFDSSREGLGRVLEQARSEFAHLPAPSAMPAGEPRPTAWLKNSVTDFALCAAGNFFWEGERQGLSFSGGGQLSRFGFYLHYHDGAERRAGTPITRRELENLCVVEPVRALSDTQAVGTLETTDEKLRLRVRALMGQGAVAAVAFEVSNLGTEAVKDVRLSAYSNLEAAHDHENDYSALDRQTASLLVVDLVTQRCVAMAGLSKPISGYSGVWPSGEQLRTAAGTPFEQWEDFTRIPPEEMKKAFAQRRPGGIFGEYAPAPFVEPTEPETHTLTAAAAEAVLQRDWLFQAEGKPLTERAQQEIRWARELAARLARNPKTPSLKPDLAELAELERQLAAFEASSSPTNLYSAIRAAKRRILFKNPAVDFTRVLFIDQPYPQGSEWRHQVRHRNGMMAVPGGRLLVLDGLSPAGTLRKLAPDRPAAFWRPDLSFDAQRVLFCMKRHDEQAFHLFEIDLDGSGLRQFTDGPYDDLDPIYLPDGKVLFSTTRGNTYIRCMPYTYSYILARCDADGRNLYLLSGQSEPEWLPAVLNDGRVIFSRWDYIDKALWRIQSLWTCRQDGTAVETFWGNQSVWPDHLTEARPIPDSVRIMFTGLAHHDWFAGSIGILDPTQGRNFPQGLTKVTAEVAWPECGNPPLDPVEAADYHPAGKFDAYKSPYPLSEEDFLVSARGGAKFRLYLMDVHGNRELIYEGAHHIWHAMPVKPRVSPPAHSDLVTWPGTGKDRQPPQPALFYSADVCQGVPDLPRAKVKALRVLQMDQKTYSLWTLDGRYSGPAVSALQDDGVKRILGTVPVEADGSVYFQAPPGKVLFFQLLDEYGRALQTMRSSVSVLPGERRGCVGCHEQHSASVPNRPALALRHEPHELTPPPWGATSISYERMVQPVLDQYCGKCHQGDGEGRKKLDLTLRPGQGIFKEPYLTLIGPVGPDPAKQPRPPGLAGALMCENYDRNDPASYVTFRPMRHLSYTSKLIEQCLSGQHHDLQLDPVSLQKLIGWVDANCPYRGDEDIRAIPDPQFAGIEHLPVRPRTKTAPVSERP